jgi:hypothetical protein
VVLFVKNRTEGLLCYDGHCWLPVEIYHQGASWLDGVPGSDNLPKHLREEPYSFEVRRLFVMTPVVVRTSK